MVSVSLVGRPPSSYSVSVSEDFDPSGWLTTVSCDFVAPSAWVVVVDVLPSGVVVVVVVVPWPSAGRAKAIAIRAASAKKRLHATIDRNIKAAKVRPPNLASEAMEDSFVVLFCIRARV